MSLILDALRKMEQERRSRRGSAQDLRPEVLRYRLAAQPQKPAKYPLAVIGAVLLCAGIGAGFLLKGNPGEVVSQATQAAAPVASPPATAAPAVPPAVAAPAPAAPALAAPATPASLPVAAVQPAPAPVEQPKARASRAVAGMPSPATVDAVPQGRPLHEDAGAVQAGVPEITISGIAYQDERRMRRAVLNGVLVGEGAEIAGARVVEIKETKVRLSRGGQVFEVPFSSGLQSR